MSELSFAMIEWLLEMIWGRGIAFRKGERGEEVIRLCERQMGVTYPSILDRFPRFAMRRCRQAVCSRCPYCLRGSHF
jgi:hypothetical protein